MWIVNLALRRPYTFIVLAIFILLAGVYSILTSRRTPQLPIRRGCGTLGSMDVQALQDELSTILPGLEGVCLVYLFGSRVEGSLRPMSDYDLALLVDRAVDGRRVQARLAHELARALQTDRVDVVLLNRASIELAYAIIAQGKLIYEQDVATRVEYEATVLSRYGDYLPVLRRQRDDILQGDDHDRRVRRYRAALGRTERTLGQIAAAQGQGSE